MPNTKVVYPNATTLLLDVPHRAADAAIRYHFTRELEELAAGNPKPLAKRNPTALIWGLWDSRRTMVKVQRVITSSIQVRGAVHRPSASSLSSPFDTDTRLKLQESGWTKDDLSQIGIGEVPAYRERGTIDTTSASIERRVFLSLSLLDKYEEKLRDYLRGLALVALLYPVPLELRSGASLVRQSRGLEAFGDCSSTPISLDSAFEDALTLARAHAAAFGVGQAETLTVDLSKIGEGIKEFKDKKDRKKGSRSVKAKGSEVGHAGSN